MAEYLDLREDCLAAPTRWDLAVIEAQMLWPHDSDMRGRFLSAVSVDAGLSTIGRVPLQDPTPVTAAEVREFGKAMRSAPRIEDFTRAGEKATEHGLVAGQILLEAVGAHAVGRKNVGLVNIKKRVGASVSRLGRTTLETVDNTVWYPYRSVAHLWAARIAVSRESKSLKFPCQLRDLGFFLAAADAYRICGETMKSAPQATKPLLRPGEAVMIPPALALPEVELIFSTKII